MWVPCGRSAGLIMNKASSGFGRIAVAPESACLRSRRIIWRRGDPDGCAAPYDAPPPAPQDPGTGGAIEPEIVRRHRYCPQPNEPGAVIHLAFDELQIGYPQLRLSIGTDLMAADRQNQYPFSPSHRKRKRHNSQSQ